MSDSEQCSNRLELDLISLLVNISCSLIEANSDTSSVGPSKKDHPFCHNAGGLKDLCLLHWDISVVSLEPNLFFVWPYKL